MPYDPSRHNRKSIRKKGYDYSQPGLYFITICVNRRDNPRWMPFGIISNGEMILNHAGEMVENEWLKLPERFPNIKLHEFVVMPNHFHGIIEIVSNPVGAPLVGAQNLRPQNLRPQNLRPQNMDIQNMDIQNMDIQNMDAQNVHPQNTDPQNLNTQNPIQTTLKPNIRESETANENRESEQNAPTDNVGAPTRGAPTVTVGDMVGAFQSITTVEYIRGVKNLAWPPFNKKLWQRNYWENIVRNHSSYQRISKYIVDNPKNWNNDKFNGNINKNPL